MSYLSYPDFDKNPHPALKNALLVDLQTFRVQYRDYSGVTVHPTIHRFFIEKKILFQTATPCVSDFPD